MAWRFPGSKIFYYFCSRCTRKDGRVVECGGLENRCPLLRTGGSNPPLSAKQKSPPKGLFCFEEPGKLACQRLGKTKKKVSEANGAFLFDAPPLGDHASNPIRQACLLLNERTSAKIEFFDMSGLTIMVMDFGVLEAGLHNKAVNFQNQECGLFFCKLTTNSFTFVKKLVQIE